MLLECTQVSGLVVFKPFPSSHSHQTI